MANGNAVRARRNGGENLARRRLDVDDGGARRTLGRTAGRSSDGVVESDGAKVGEGDERATRLVVLDDPLGVLFAKSGGGSEGFGDSLAGGQVLDDGSARLGSGGGNGDLDGIASLDGKVGEIVGGGGGEGQQRGERRSGGGQRRGGGGGGNRGRGQRFAQGLGGRVVGAASA